jgi:hypothetical protein
MKKIFLSLIFLSSVMLIQTDLISRGEGTHCGLFLPCDDPFVCGVLHGNCMCPGTSVFNGVGCSPDSME